MSESATGEDSSLNFRSRKLWRSTFAISILLRAYFSMKLSYIHPDEHLQGPQVVASEYFGWAAQQVWDFQGPHAIRSHVPLWLIYGIPMSFFPDNVDPLRILYVIRAVIAVLTWILTDMAIDRLSRDKNEQLRGLLFVSTSYVTWVYQSRTLSNSLETILVLWFLVIIHEFQQLPSSYFDKTYDILLLALITVLGVFNRPNFVAWLVIPSLSLLKFFLKHPSTLVTFAFGLLLFTAGFIYVDTVLYGSEDWVFAPLNNVLYNISTDNLKEHGLHPRWVHVLVNLPQLFGTGLLLLRPKWNLAMQAAVSGVAVLSLIPHQEARFLVPLVPLLSLQMDISHFGKKLQRFLIALWLIFNVLAGVLMGVFHQGGVIPAQTFLKSVELPATVMWWKTYAPPLWVLGLPSAKVLDGSLNDYTADEMVTFFSSSEYDPSQDRMTIVDLQGWPLTDAQKVMEALPRPIYFVAPTASDHKNVTGDSPIVWETYEHSTLELYDIFRLESFHPGLSIWKIE